MRSFGDQGAGNAALTPARPDYSCRCEELGHDHPWGSRCPRRAAWAGGTCDECRYWSSTPEHRAAP